MVLLWFHLQHDVFLPQKYGALILTSQPPSEHYKTPLEIKL